LRLLLRRRKARRKHKGFEDTAMLRQLRKVLAPVDFSDHSMRALRGALELANEVGAALHVVYVVATHQSILERGRELAREASMVEQAEEEFSRIRKDELGNSEKVITAVLVGPPAATLIEYAKQESIDLILLATHGRTGAEHLLMGGVTEKLARLAPCSVLVFRAR
jgi:nucleotide-binding universal stress UspA family protein